MKRWVSGRLWVLLSRCDVLMTLLLLLHTVLCVMLSFTPQFLILNLNILDSDIKLHS